MDELTHTNIIPEFNTLVHFAVPRPHSVSAVVGSRPRLAVYGWLLTPKVTIVRSMEELVGDFCANKNESEDVEAANHPQKEQSWVSLSSSAYDPTFPRAIGLLATDFAEESAASTMRFAARFAKSAMEPLGLAFDEAEFCGIKVMREQREKVTMADFVHFFISNSPTLFRFFGLSQSRSCVIMLPPVDTREHDRLSAHGQLEKRDSGDSLMYLTRFWLNSNVCFDMEALSWHIESRRHCWNARTLGSLGERDLLGITLSRFPKLIILQKDQKRKRGACEQKYRRKGCDWVSSRSVGVAPPCSKVGEPSYSGHQGVDVRKRRSLYGYGERQLSALASSLAQLCHVIVCNDDGDMETIRSAYGDTDSFGVLFIHQNRLHWLSESKSSLSVSFIKNLISKDDETSA